MPIVGGIEVVAISRIQAFYRNPDGTYTYGVRSELSDPINNGGPHDGEPGIDAIVVTRIQPSDSEIEATLREHAAISLTDYFGAEFTAADIRGLKI